MDYQLLEKHDVANMAWEKVMVFEEGGAEEEEKLSENGYDVRLHNRC